MFPFDAPLGTTPLDYVQRFVPEAHRRTVPPDTRGKRWHVGVRIGETPVRYEVDGQDIDVSADDADDAHLSLALEHDDIERFLADMAGPRRYVPRFPPRGAALVTDPRLLARVAQVTGSFAAAVPDFPGGPVKLVLAAFGGKRGTFDARSREADVTVELPTRAFESLLAGELLPDEALSSGALAIRGKKLVAMQLAFAIVPFFPPRTS